MKFIKNQNLNYINNDYLKEHFAEEDDDNQVPLGF